MSDDRPGTVDAFLACVTEARWPPTTVERRAGVSPLVTFVRWEPPMPDAVGRRARELTGLTMGWPTAVQGAPQSGAWWEAWLIDNDQLPIRPAEAWRIVNEPGFPAADQP